MEMSNNINEQQMEMRWMSKARNLAARASGFTGVQINQI